MSSQKRDHILPPPPRIVREAELPPIIEPGFRDFTPPVEVKTIEEYDTFESQIVEDPLTSEIVHKAQAVALANVQVNQMLSNKRYISIGASIVESKSESDEHEMSLMYVLYDYTDNVAIEVFLDKNANKVMETRQSRYQPAPVKEETEEAIMLARKDSRLTEKLTEDMEGMAILVSSLNIDDKNYGHRLLDVRFGFPDERLPRYMALVDLSSEIVLKAGPLRRDKMVHKGGQE